MRPRAVAAGAILMATLGTVTALALWRYQAVGPPTATHYPIAAGAHGDGVGGRQVAASSQGARPAAGPKTKTGTTASALPPPSTTVTSSAPVPIAVSVAASCAEPSGVQTVTVTSRPGLQVTINLRYADGQSGGVYGGLVVAQTIGSPDGTYRETFTLSPKAPIGPVAVYAGVASTSGPRVAATGSTSFLVAASC